jgi:NAD(P)-dependent dehydrogenase (short-subunit alcohol dehydrogenase family)
MEATLEGKVVLVTGGASGIGRAASVAFAREGAKVAIADLNLPGAEETARMIEDTGGAATAFEADVSKSDQVSSLIDKVVQSSGRLDCAFNNAGIMGRPGTTVECTEENWDRVIAVNLKSVWLCMKYEIPHMEKQGGGSIVNTASIYGLAGAPDGIVYNAAKHGVIGATKVAALEYATAGIRVNAVCPGFIRTPLAFEGGVPPDTEPEVERSMLSQTPVGRLGEPEDIAEAVVWLSSDAASFVTGHTMASDGGFLAQ